MKKLYFVFWGKYKKFEKPKILNIRLRNDTSYFYYLQ